MFVNPTWLTSVLRRKFLKDSSGGPAVMVALTSPVLLGVVAFAVDEGSLYYQVRDQQAATDMAAIVAAANIDKADLAAKTTLSDNGFAVGSVKSDKASYKVETGIYVADPAISPDLRFTPGGGAPNGVR